MRMLRPGGKLLISDYCRAPEAPSSGFAAYIKQRGYDLHSVAAYAGMLQQAGFVDVKGEDRTWQVRPTLPAGSTSGCILLVCIHVPASLCLAFKRSL